MKTTRFLMMFVAATALMFASCGKDDNNENGSDNNGPSLTDNNIIALNNDIAAVESSVTLFAGEQHYVINCNCNQCHFIADIDIPLIGTTIDLSTALDAQGNYGFSYEGELTGEYYEIRQGGGYGNIYSYNQNGDQIATPAYASGTLTTVNDDNGFTLTINGTLKGNKTFVARIFIEKENVGYEAEG